jgi:hypothetical protein
MAVKIEMIVDWGVIGSKLPQGLDVLNLVNAPSRRRIGRCEYLARLLRQRPHS